LRKVLNNQYPAKILLFGEYGIVKGSKGIAFPLNTFSGELKKGKSHLSSDLSSFVDHIKRSKILNRELDLHRLENDIQNNLIFESNIPQGYGVGSSGALCAAVFGEYAKNFRRESEYDSNDLGYIQELMAMMESFFHGKSSGLDPLISFINLPLLIQNSQQVSIVEKPNLTFMGQFYLLDTKIQRKTSPLVHQFLKDCSDEKYLDGIDKYMNLTNLIIDDLLNLNKQSFVERFKDVSRLQYIYFEKMIPSSLKDIWLSGLENKEYYMKLCGAGGGGFFLVYSLEGKVPLEHTLIKLS
jgi:mevalonate kinase